METSKGGGNFDLTREQKQMRQLSEQKALKEYQKGVLSGDYEEKLVTCNVNSNYKIREIESKGYVVVLVTDRHLNQDQQTFKDVQSTVLIHAGEFDNRVKSGAFATYFSAEVLHDPRIKKGQSAPVYELKPSQVNTSGSVQKKLDTVASKDLEAATARLDKVAEQQQQRKATLETKEAELQTKEEEITTKQAQIDSAKESIAKASEAVTAKAGELSAQESDIAQRAAELEKKEKELLAREKALKTPKPEGEKPTAS